MRSSSQNHAGASRARTLKLAAVWLAIIAVLAGLVRPP